MTRSIGALQQNVWLSGPSRMRLGGTRHSTTNANWSEEPNMGVSLSVHESCSLWATATEVNPQNMSSSVRTPDTQSAHGGRGVCGLPLGETSDLPEIRGG